MKMHIPMLSAFAGLAMFAAGCGGTEMDTEDPSMTAEPERTVTAMDTRYCVDQSSAAAQFYGTCPTNGLREDTRLSRGHPVHVYGVCAQTTVGYWWVVSLWNGQQYIMRPDAFKPC